ncbi:MAG: nitrile hydratase subunit alpha [Alphaproteobacteria bacterium]|nr:nitrile hydratase subunit alpha [Alphaproteobacteria bacterium]
MQALHEHPHGHDHEHGHGHAPPQPDEKIHSYYQLLGLALKEVLIDKGIFTADEMRRAIEARDSITPAGGARIVARAWTDSAYKARLLADGAKAVREMGVDPGETRLVVVENTPSLHNVIVCTLCSCYPRQIIGLPPSWYKSREYRARIVREPRAVLKEFGTELADGMEVRVHDSTADMRYLVLPMRPVGSEGLDEAALAGLVTRDCMIGVTVPKLG